MRRPLAFLSLLALVLHCGCERHIEFRPTTKGKVLLAISLEERERLLERLGFKNVPSSSLGRDSKGDRLFWSVSASGEQETNKEYLIVVTAQGAQVKPRRIANLWPSDEGELAVWQEKKGMEFGYRMQNGEWLPEGSCPKEVAGDWILLSAPGRNQWLAKRDTPSVVAAEFPGPDDTRIHVFADGQVVHVFVTRIWWVPDPNAKGGHAVDKESLEYLIFDFTRSDRQLVKKITLPSWTACGVEMDPETGMVVINSSPSGWRSYTLLDLNTGKERALSDSTWKFFVNKEVAQEWIELTK
jgi:hypothetical protein